MNDEPLRSVYDPCSVRLTNRAVFGLHPQAAMLASLRSGVRLTAWQVLPSGLLEFALAGDAENILAPTRFKITIAPIAIVAKLLPQGNKIRECWIVEDGTLEFVFEGIDAPHPIGEELPKMRLMLGTSPNGARSTWFEPFGDPEPIDPNDTLSVKLRDLLNKHPGKDAA